MLTAQLNMELGRRTKNSSVRAQHLEKATRSLKRAQSILNKILKYKKNDYYSELYAKFCVLYVLRGDASSMALAKKMFYNHVDIFGPNHKRTLKIVEYFDKNNITVPW